MVDVDGVISLFGFDSAAPPSGQFVLVDGIGHLLSASAGAHLRALRSHFELIWCTGWEEKANDYLPHALGLPGPLPYLSFDHNPGRGDTHWKLAAVDAYAGPDRALAWIDDALGPECARWAADRSAPTLLLPTDPAIGITEAHVAELTAFDLTCRTGSGGAQSSRTGGQ